MYNHRHIAFLDRTSVSCNKDEFLQYFHYQRNPHNGDEYRYEIKCKKALSVIKEKKLVY